MNHLDRFHALDALLTTQQALWQPAPFCQPSLPWSETLPDLHQALMDLSDTELVILEQNESALLDFLTRFIPDLRTVPELLALPASVQVQEFNAHWSNGIPGRKLEQVAAFSGALELSEQDANAQANALPLLDWCAGKAHLGRLLAAVSGSGFTAIERDAELCAQGRLAAQKLKLQAQFICADVLVETMQCAAALKPATHALALHACGDLHTSLLTLSVHNHVQRVSVSPCCYHLQRAPLYVPLSNAASKTALQFDRALLHLAVEETVTSSARICAQRDQMALWRLAFDEWRRLHTGCDSYMPTPPLPYSVLVQGFPAFMCRLAQDRGLEMASEPEYQTLLQRAQSRLSAVRRLQLVRHGFRRALELWLVLDRVLYLQEHGYEVRLATFCARALTPRNILIDARLLN